MKIAFIIYDLTDGGAEKVVSLLTRSLTKEHDISIVLFDNKVDYPYGGKIIDLNTPAKSGYINKILNIFVRILKLRKLLKENDFDHIFSFMESANIPSLLVNKNTVVSIRNNPKMFSKLTQFLIKKLYPRAKKVIVNSYANKEILQKDFLLDNVDVIYNPLNLLEIEKKSQEQIDIKDEFIMAVGRLHLQKGFDMLIDAYANSTIPRSVKLLIFGEGKLKDELQSQINRYNLANSIVLMGRTDNPYKYLAKAKAFILSSRYEGFPNVLIEAMSCQCPSIAFDCLTGPSEIIKDQHNGLLVEKENVEKLSNALNKLYFNGDLQIEIAKNSLAFVNELQVDHISKKWLQIA